MHMSVLLRMPVALTAPENLLYAMKTMSIHTLYILLSLAAACLTVPLQAAERVPLKLWYDEPAVEWMTSALPVGNGDMGAMFRRCGS